MKKRLITACVCCVFSSSADAGFLEDMYNQAGAMSNYTPGGIYTSETVGAATGGRYVLKVPRKEFAPYSIQAPSLKAGCGGIDLFLGGFSIPSKEEFVSFVRSIGTALPGLAFHLALQTMAPDLNEQVSQFRDMLMEASKQLGDSCEAAQALMDKSGASGWIINMTQKAKNSLRASGEAQDQADAKEMTRTNGAKLFSSTPSRTDELGNAVEAPEMNLTWSLLKSQKSTKHLDDQTLEILMSIAGTTIFTKHGQGEDTTVRQEGLPPLDLLYELLDVGFSKPSISFTVYKCDETVKCLRPYSTSASDINLTSRILSIMLNYRDSIRNRTPEKINDQELVLINGLSSLPLLKLSELAASPRIASFSEAYLQSYAEAAAHEYVLEVLTTLASSVKRSISVSSARSANAIVDEHAQRIEDRLGFLIEQLKRRGDEVNARLQNAQLFREEVEHLSRLVWGDPASALVPKGL